MSDTVLPDPKERRIAELENQLAQAHATIEALQEQLRQLQAAVEAQKRAGKRQATPFSRQKRAKNPKRPGRKAGQGTFTRQEKPASEAVNDTKEAPLPCCQECGGGLTEMKDHEHFEVDIPSVRPVVTRYVSHSGYCEQCKKRVRSRHPDQLSTATGAAGVSVGPRAKALAADLKHRLGLSYEKAADLLETAFGLSVTRSGLCQAEGRLAEKARPVYARLVVALRQCAVVHADETGWRINTLSAWLWVFTNQEITVYAIRKSRGHEVVVDILGREFKGVLVSDCFLAYNAKALVEWLKQKCVAHLLRNLSEIAADKRGRAVCFSRDVTALLRKAMALQKEKPSLSPEIFGQRAADLETRLDALIDNKRRMTDPDNVRFAKRLRQHRPHLLRFLYVEGLAATNNQAERQLRPAVITRKTAGCNRTEGGAETHAILASVLVTCRQQKRSILDYLVELQRSPDTLPPLLTELNAIPP
jgi:hypothetical protein